MNTLSTQRMTTSEGPRKEGPVEAFVPIQGESPKCKIHPNCETLPKVQNTQMIMRVSMKLRHDRERIHNTASTHNGDLIAKAPNQMVAENAKQLSGV